MQRKIADVVIECVRGEITAQKDMDAVVNAANAELRPKNIIHCLGPVYGQEALKPHQNALRSLSN